MFHTTNPGLKKHRTYEGNSKSDFAPKVTLRSDFKVKYIEISVFRQYMTILYIRFKYYIMDYNMLLEGGNRI